MIRAIHYPDRDKHREDKVPGSFWMTEPGDGDVVAMWFWCPSGSGQMCRIELGVKHKPITSPSWDWNGSTTEPTLKPSVNIAPSASGPGWHGWLQDGYWRAC